MAKKKAATRKRESTPRRKKVKATQRTTDSPGGAASEATEQGKPTAAKPKGDRPAAKRKKVARRSKKKTVAAEPTAERSAQKTTTTGQQTVTSGEPAAPAAPGKRQGRKRRAARKPRYRKAAARRESGEQTPAPPLVKPMSPSAEVEQLEDTIVIRFPSAAPPSSPASKPPPAAEKATDDQAAMEPPIDWELADGPAATTDDLETAAEPPLATDDSGADTVVPVPNDDTTATPGSRIDEEGVPIRAKRRRRRKRKDPRVALEKEAPTDERPDAKDKRQRPEPVDAAEPTPEEKPARRRRRRPRRGRKPEAATEGAEDKDVAARPAEPLEASKAAPAGQKEMIINVVPHEECRIAIMENGKLQEIYLERASAENYVGNIYKGIVTNVEPSIQAAFVDFGQGKNGFLHVSDLHPQYFPNGEGHTENVGRKMPRRSRPPIQRCLRRSQQLLVQITKEGIGTKGPTLTTYLSIPGRFLVMMPGMRQLGVSRKIEDDEARRKLRDQLVELDLPGDIGFIARTAALGRTKRELQSDLNYLSRLWKAVGKRIENQKPPAEIYTESDLVIRTIRDVYTSDITRIVVDDADVAQRAHEFLSIFSPRSRDAVVEYDQPEPIFHHYGIEAELERLHLRHVPLRSGGSLVIDQTEALVAVDVNSGRFRAEDDAETTAYKINLEAADEIPRQLRLRDLGGVVICDFIDMRMERHKREIERRLNHNLKEHKERAKLLRMSEFGIIEMTRQRQRASLTRSVYQDCHHCHGSGLVKTAESVTLDVMRLIQLAATRESIRSIEVAVSPEVAHLLQNRKRAALHELESKNQRSISVRTASTFSLDQIEVHCRDPRGRVVQHP